MRAVVQRVREASVTVADRTTGAIGHGLLVLLSVGHDDTATDAGYMTDKLAGLRIFPDEAARMNRDVAQAGGAILLVSQFTLHGDVRRGKRPAFTAAMEPVAAAQMIDAVAVGLRAAGLQVAEGEFGADMQVHSCNDGPVTILLDSKKLF
ncbi:MAG: D-tyrosyl-tRNA(Tyr) deacylase [Myxococcales bacterium]|nr:D-tyrosyl-tRNA(Tyr) deacylase [Myxococcales bacterium]